MASPVTPFAVALSALLTCAPAGAADGEAITESDALRMFLEQSPQARRVPLVAQSAGAERREDAQVSNPAVAYQVEDAAGLRDEFLTFAQELPISGRRGLVRDSADAAASAAGLAAKRGLLASASALRASFYEVLYRERVAALLQEGTARLARTVEILARREREGEGSGYELRRAEQERADLAITGAEAGAALAAARTRFGSFFDPERHLESARLAGDLAPAGAVPETEGAIEQAASMRDDLRALQEDARRLDLKRQAARRRRWPEPTVTAGWKRVEAPGVADTRFVAAAALPLPIFDRGQVVAATALSAGLALVPLALAGSHPGAELEAPMAVVILFGLLSATALNMVVVPIAYSRFSPLRRSYDP